MTYDEMTPEELERIALYEPGLEGVDEEAEDRWEEEFGGEYHE